MAYSIQPASPTLPGPVTASSAYCPPHSTTTPMQKLSASNASVASSVDEKTKKNMAWKYEGYQAFSKWMASDDDFFVFRRFESLNANTILWMQDHISRLEKELASIHIEVEKSRLEDFKKNSSFRWDAACKNRRNEIMFELSRQLLHYSQSRLSETLKLVSQTIRSIHRHIFESSRTATSRQTPGSESSELA